MVWPFNRNRTDKNSVPKEVQDYYQAERRERVGIAWVLALVTLVVTVLLALGLFFGGRWAYRQIFDKNDSPSVTKDEKDEAGSLPTETEKPTDDKQEDASTGVDTSDSQEETAPATTTRTPNTGGHQELPNTGPEFPL